MTDYFSLFGEAPRPWLDPEVLKKKFLSLSGELHPDRLQNSPAATSGGRDSRYAELNQAYQQLRNPKLLLQYFLQVETGGKPEQVREIPAELTGFFLEVGQLFQAVDRFLSEKAKVSSPLLRVQFFEAGQNWTEKLTALKQQLDLRQQELLSDLKAIDDRWVSGAKTDPMARTEMLQRLEELYRLFSYFSRWENQVQEKVLELSL